MVCITQMEVVHGPLGYPNSSSSSSSSSSQTQYTIEEICSLKEAGLWD